MEFLSLVTLIRKVRIVNMRKLNHVTKIMEPLFKILEILTVFSTSSYHDEKEIFKNLGEIRTNHFLPSERVAHKVTICGLNKNSIF